jgi:hypothetical protein
MMKSPAMKTIANVKQSALATALRLKMTARAQTIIPPENSQKKRASICGKVKGKGKKLKGKNRIRIEAGHKK